MSKTVKIAISLPEEILLEAERARQASGQSRSEFFRQAVQLMIRAEQEREEDERYIRAYREQPETDEEVQQVEALAFEALAQEPWE